MADEKDRFGDKLHDVEKAREDQWAREEDQRLLEKLRRRKAGVLHCPQCDTSLVERAQAGIAILACPSGHGAWLETAALERLGKH